MTIHTVDVAIIGAGTAGLGARRAAKKSGASVLMIDPGPFGTTCARVGCMPSKLLIAAADAAHQAQGAGLFGVETEVVIDGPAVLSRVRTERDRFVGFVVEVIDEAREEGELLEEIARVVRPGVIEAGVHEVHFERLVVAAGTSPFTPPPFRGLPDEVLLTNEHIFELTDLPESLLVIGLGVIGLELGQAFARLGVRTTLLGQEGAIGPLSDPEIKATALELLRQELDLHPTYTLGEINARDGGVRISFVDSVGRQREETFAKVLMAAGRRTTLPKLGLDAYDTSLEGRNWPIDRATLQLGSHPVFVAGDVNELHPLLHEAADDGRIAGQNAGTYPPIRAAVRRTPLTVVFTDPQIGLVGQTWRELGSGEVSAGEVDYGDQGRARVAGINQGKVRIYADSGTGVLLGAELFGPGVEHLCHLLAWAIQANLTVSDALAMPFYHPVLEEGVRTALRDLSANLRHGRGIKCRVSEMGVGS